MNVFIYLHITYYTHTHTEFSYFVWFCSRKIVTGIWGPWQPDFALSAAALVICIAWLTTDRLITCRGCGKPRGKPRGFNGKPTGKPRKTREKPGDFLIFAGNRMEKGTRMKWREGAFQANPGVFVKRNDVSPAWTHVSWEENTVFFADSTGKHHLWREIAWNSCKKWEFPHADFKEKITRRQRFLGGYIIWLVVWNVNSISN